MRAAVLHAPAPIERAPLALEDVPAPVPGPGELLLRVRCCGICRTDLHVVEGELAPRLTPVIPGHQVVAEVIGHGPGVDQPPLSTRVGVAWLHRTCEVCRFCGSGRENLCDRPEFTGWTRNGGFAELLVAPAAFVHALPERFSDLQAAPLLCAGIIGYRALRRAGVLEHGPGMRLGIYGFGAAGHVCIQVARARGAEVYVCTRQARHRALASELGASWVGETVSPPPRALDAAVIFAPAGELVPVALSALAPGGTLVLGGIHMSPIPELDYPLIYGERTITSVAHNTRVDAREFLRDAAEIPVQTHVTSFALEDANTALHALKHDGFRGAGVLVL